MKKLFNWGLIVIILLLASGCGTKEESDAARFKREYEEYNNQISITGKEYRTVNIKEDNPMVYKTAGQIVSAIKNSDTFLVYFGFSTCPWCRSMIENLIKAAQDENIETIYYVDVYDIRDVLAVDENGNIKTLENGSSDYLELIDLLKDVLSDYTLTDNDGKVINTGEKRIYAPNVVYIKNGKAVGITSGNSNLQTDSYMDLTDEILNDSYNMIISLFQK